MIILIEKDAKLKEKIKLKAVMEAPRYIKKIAIKKNKEIV